VTLLLTIEEALRLAAATHLLALAILLLRDHRQSRVAQASALFVVCVACYLVLPALLAHAFLPAFHGVALVGALAVPFAFWLATRFHFEDGYSPSSAEVAVILLLLAVRCGLAAARGGAPLTDYGPNSWTLASNGLAIVVVADALRRIHVGASADLLLTRLRLRYAVLSGCGVYALTVLVAEATVTPGSAADRWLSLANAVGLFLFVFASATLLLRVQPDFVKAMAPRNAPPGVGGLPEALAALIETERIYTTPGLTIGLLAERLGEHEYKLRQTVNSQLGFRNFNAFLNHYRIRDARQLLADPGQNALGIAEVAYRLGYASLGPFNRAFMEMTGQTPSEFRKAAQQEQSFADSGIGEPHSKAR
jgi:AraC-like DNA-binding protein